MTDSTEQVEVDLERIERVLEAALLAAGRPLSIADLEGLFAGDGEPPPREAIRRALSALAETWAGRSLVLKEVASGFRAQVRDEFEPWIARLWEEKPPRYSRALLETLAIIAYRQPITRSEIEDIRGVSVSTQIMRTLDEREWVRVVGHRETPGRPAMYGTTRQFLDHFNLKTLDQLPPLSEIREEADAYPELAFDGAGAPAGAEAPGGGVGEPVSDAGPDDGVPGEEGTGAERCFDDGGADDPDGADAAGHGAEDSSRPSGESRDAPPANPYDEEPEPQ